MACEPDPRTPVVQKAILKNGPFLCGSGFGPRGGRGASTPGPVWYTRLYVSVQVPCEARRTRSAWRTWPVEHVTPSEDPPAPATHILVSFSVELVHDPATATTSPPHSLTASQPLSLTASHRTPGNPTTVTDALTAHCFPEDGSHHFVCCENIQLTDNPHSPYGNLNPLGRVIRAASNSSNFSWCVSRRASLASSLPRFLAPSPSISRVSHPAVICT